MPASPILSGFLALPLVFLFPSDLSTHLGFEGLHTTILESSTFVDPGNPHIVPLRRESVPVVRNGKVASWKTSYSGVLRAGAPTQDFTVLFDTGSGHLVLPAVECVSESCVKHHRFNATASSSSTAINIDGSVAGEECDEISIKFGTGAVTGQFVRETVCVGSESETCVDMHVVLAVEMTVEPFSSFSFDGILGLGLKGLSMTSDLSFFDLWSRSRTPLFGIFLSEGESELALGGYNLERLRGPLSWAPVALEHLGYWQVDILALRIGGVVSDICLDGTCRGVVDSGTSHLGVPHSHFLAFDDLLTTPSATDVVDCRQVRAPLLEIVLKTVTLSLHADTYMRQLALPPGENLGSREPSDSDMSRCSPRLLPVNVGAPLGPKLFILGEPVLQQYYTVFDWQRNQIGFGLASRASSKLGDSVSFLQVEVLVQRRKCGSGRSARGF